MIRILLIEDDPFARAAMHSELVQQRDFALVGEPTGFLEAQARLAKHDYDLVLLAAPLRDGEPFDLLPSVRRGARLVFITESDNATIAALESSAVEYWLKPATPQRLARLVERLRAPGPSTSCLVPVRIGMQTRLLRADDIRLLISRQNYTEVTLSSGERIFVRRTLQQWIELLPERQFALVHRGLVLNLDQVARFDRGPAQSTRLHFAGSAQGPLEVKRRHWPVLRNQLELWRSLNRPGGSVLPAEKSIAVLPFANLSGDHADEIFCDGITEELLNVLAKVPRLRVAARTSVFSFKGKSTAVPEIARQLGVDYLVEGSVRRTGKRVRITAQLIGAADGFHVWSENFERELTGILTVQDEIAGLIALSLHMRLANDSLERRPVDPQAHWLVLEGRHYWNLRTHDGLTRAEAAFAKAQALAPTFAPASAGLADVCNIRALYRLSDGILDVGDDLERAKLASKRALLLDPSLAEAYATLGFVAFHEGRLDDAERALLRALTANPSYATAYQYYAWTLCAQGRLDRALAIYARSIECDPLSFISIDRYAAMLVLARRWDDALAMNERAATLRADVFVGNLSQRAPILLALDRREEAIAAARMTRAIPHHVPFRRTSDADALFVLQQTGHVGEAREYADEWLARLPANNYLRGFVLGAVQRFEEAIPCLQYAPTIMLPFLYWAQVWDPIRQSAPFQQLLCQLGRSAEYALARSTVVESRSHHNRSN